MDLLDLSDSNWWTHRGVNPELSWAELVLLAVEILTNERTPTALQLPKTPLTLEVVEELPENFVSGAKRINARRGEYRDYTEAMGINFLLNPTKAQEILRDPPIKDTGTRFRLYGKEEGTAVEGTWEDWYCFANNILASANTQLVAPGVYDPDRKNDNY